MKYIHTLCLYKATFFFCWFTDPQTLEEVFQIQKNQLKKKIITNNELLRYFDCHLTKLKHIRILHKICKNTSFH